MLKFDQYLVNLRLIMKLKKVDAKKISDNSFKILDNDWMLIAAGNKEKYNMMTASWGGFGIMWGKEVCYIVIRPSRHTYDFTESNDYFSLNFFTEDYRKILKVCGSKSGRDIDKMKDVDLTAVEEKNTIYFEESRLVMICKKIYYQDLVPENFLDISIEGNYKGKDYHRMYIGEIIKTYQKS